MKKEKHLRGVAIGSGVVLIGAGLWWHHINVAPVLTVPPVKLPKPNAFDFFVKAGKAHDALKVANPGSDSVDPITDKNRRRNLTPQQLAQRYPSAKKVVWVKKNAEVLKTLRQGFAYEYKEPPRPWDAPYLHLAQFRRLARLLIIESHTRSEQGDWTGASRSTVDILRLGNAVPHGSATVGAYVGSAINAIGGRELQKIMPHLDATTARAAAQEIEKLQARRFPLAETLQKDKWGMLVGLQEYMRDTNVRVLLLKAPMTKNWKRRARWFLYSNNTMTNNFERYMDALTAQARRPYLKRQWPTMPTDPVNEILVPEFNKAPFQVALDEARNLLLMVQFALHTFELEHHRLPDTLNELTPAYLKKVPHDPFGGGEALRYRKTGNTYLLYSIGPDGKDDGGKAIDRPPSKPIPNASSDPRFWVLANSIGDSVAGINH